MLIYEEVTVLFSEDHFLADFSISFPGNISYQYTIKIPVSRIDKWFTDIRDIKIWLPRKKLKIGCSCNTNC